MFEGQIAMSSYDAIVGELRQMLQPLAKKSTEVREDTELVADLGLDSVQIMDLLMQVEDQFDVSIPLNVLPEVRTVKDLAVQIQTLTVESK
jgi:acyl carrier protein